MLFSISLFPRGYSSPIPLIASAIAENSLERPTITCPISGHLPLSGDLLEFIDERLGLVGEAGRLVE
jgi:hypothetical protein